MISEVGTQPEPEHIARAGDLLGAVLAGDLDIDERLALGACQATLYDVHPPYAPRPQPTQAIGLATALPLILEALAQASDSIPDAIRAGLAARELRPLRGIQ